MHKNIVFQWMQNNFEFTKFIIEQLSEKLSKNVESLSNLSLLNTKDRLLNIIYRHYIMGDLCSLTKDKLCSETFIPLRSLNRSIAECKEEGLILYQEKRFFIQSIKKLEQYCENIM